MNKKLNNKGFSLVELIIVIAIMAVLVGVLAPQFIKYVEQSRRSTDIQNADMLKEAYQADIADLTTSSNIAFTAVTSSNKPAAVATVPAIKGNVCGSGAQFYVVADAGTGEVTIYIGASGATSASGCYAVTELDGAASYKSH